jgi:hypothetical protein
MSAACSTGHCGYARLRFVVGCATVAFAGFFFVVLTSSRLFLSASIRLTTLGGADDDGTAGEPDSDGGAESAVHGGHERDTGWTVECQTGCFLTTNRYLISTVSGCCANQPNQNARCAGTRGKTSFGSRSDRRWPSSTTHTCPSASTT